MKYFIANVKEQPWYVTLGFVLFIMMVFGAVAFLIADNPRFVLALIVGGLTWALVFWSFIAFFKFVTSWVDSKRNDDLNK